MSNCDDLGKKRKERKSYAVAYVTVLLMFIFALELFRNYYLLQSYISKSLDAIISALLGIAIVNALYEFFARNHALEELEIAVTKAICDGKDSIKRLSVPERQKLVKNSINAIIDDEKGSLVYDALVFPYLDATYNFRKEYKYHITINDVQSPLNWGTDVLTNEDYVSIHQNLCYSRIYNDSVPKKLCIGFAFDEDVLDTWMAKDEFFFRELLYLKKEHIEQLEKLDEAGLTDFLKYIFQFSVVYYARDNSITLNWDNIHVRKENKGFLLCLDLESVDSELCDNNLQKLNINFRMPQLRSCRRFLVAFAEPTQNPYIEFKFSESIKSVVPFVFLSNKIDYDLKKPSDNCLTIEIHGWLFPKSGILFTWDKERNNMTKQKMYITKLTYNTWQKSIYLQGEDSEQGEANFKRVLKELEQVGENSLDWQEYLCNALSHLAQNGFSQIPK